MLRADPGSPEPPQPSLDRIPDLVADTRASGLDVRLTDTVAGTPPDGVGRTCYRIVQEALTNAAKHAPGAVVRVTLGGAAGGTLDIGVRNGPAPLRPARPPASGFGLLGLGERITVAGGHPILSPAATARVIAAATGPDSSHVRGRSREDARERLSVLTERERETARAVADGLGNPQIAERLRITVATVKAHTGSLFAKLGVENRVQIALLVRDAEDPPQA
ncbi:LuxR C-terminal-related transcriptional regulator [Streptomyces sp. CoH17]|uniref:LuxR C-terminal-related transcriptional regulator n=1 Tax=Streptomyces sp. CoH17 TaxID=2992806 RepID=UPI002271B1CA|nr:LuxR C-terminal-related transcriptional regulator [Streptomyces sp. CoH17]